MITNDTINGNYVSYESDDQYASSAVSFLKNLNTDEAQVFFTHADRFYVTPFADTNMRHFTLSYQPDKSFLIESKK
jgi:hypothetical protein